MNKLVRFLKNYKITLICGRGVFRLGRSVKSRAMTLLTGFYRLIDVWGSARSFRQAKFLSLSEPLALAQSGSELYVLSTGDKVISKALYVKGEFDFDKFTEALKLTDLCKLGTSITLFDIGANIGSIGIPAVNRGVVDRCVAFELEPLNTKLLKANVVLNDVESQFDIYELGLGAEQGLGQIELSDSNYGDHRVRTTEPSKGLYNEQSRKTAQVRIDVLDNYIGHITAGSTLVWMDVQGFEGHVLSGARRFMTSRAPMVLEFWPYGLERSGGYSLLVEALLASPYEFFVDLDAQNKQRTLLTKDTLEDLRCQLRPDDLFTDILIL